MPALLICSTQRSGSTYLCRLLAGTGVAGDPHEYFEAMAETGVPPHPGFFLAGLPRTGAGIRDDDTQTHAPGYSDLRSVDSWRAHLEQTFRRGTTPNGVFSAKLMWNQLPEVERLAASLPELAGLSGAGLLDELFGHPQYVWMRRCDKVQQAISLWRALQTRTWRREHHDAGEAPVVVYSFDGIEHLRRRLVADENSWGKFFTDSSIEPVDLTYEDDLEQAPVEAVTRVLAAIDVTVPATWKPKTKMHRQADDLNLAWRDAYDRDVARQAT
jgi:LPS sulfotransferase NodH